MAEGAASGTVLDALLGGLAAQGQNGDPEAGGPQMSAYPVRGTIDLVALADAVESALRGDTSDEQEAKTPAELNAANDG